LKKDIEEIKDSLKNVDETLIKQEANLKLHMYRTELAEKRLEHIESDLTPIKSHIAGVNGVFKALIALSVILGIAASVVKLM